MCAIGVKNNFFHPKQCLEIAPDLSHLQDSYKIELVFKFVQISIMLLTDNHFPYQSWLHNFYTIKINRKNPL